MDIDANFTWCSFFDGDDDAAAANNCSYDATVTNDSALDFALDPENPYSHFKNMSRFWVKRVLYPIIMCVGILGNGITIVILTRRRMRSSTNHYLTALAISDLFYLIFAFTLSFDHFPAMHNYVYYSYWCYALMLTDACSNTSVWLTVTFTIERYVAVCHPIRGKVLCTRSRAKKVVGAVVCMCFLVVIPTPFEWVVVEETDASNRTRVVATYSALGRDDTYRQVYYWFTSVTFVFLPLFLLAVFNSFLIRSVHQSKTQRRRMTMRGHRNDNTHQENRITIMLIAVVIMFLLCQLPTAVTLVYTSIYSVEEDPGVGDLFRGLGNIFNSLVAVNAACNFILYCAFSDKYRQIFLKTFIPCMFTKGSPTHSQSNMNTAYSQVEIDSLGGSFRRGKSSKRGPSRKNGHGSPGMKVSIKHSNGHSRSANGVNGVNGVNGSAKFQHRFLQVPLDNGVSSAREDSIGSDSTADTTVSCSELIILPAANGKSTTVSYNYHDSNRSSPASEGTQRRNHNSSATTEHVISLTSPNGNDHLL